MVGDFNGDGTQDIAQVLPTTGEVRIYDNDGSGSFSPRMLTETLVSPRTVTSGDLDGDGDLDLVVSELTTGNVAWLINDSTGDFTQVAVGQAAAFNGTQLLLADLDGDSDLDIAGSFRDSDSIVWFNNSTVASLPNPINGPIEIHGSDGDDILELYVTGADSGTLHYTRDLGGPSESAVGPLDFDGVTGLTFNGLRGDDRLIIHNPMGSVFDPTEGIVFNGGDGGEGNGVGNPDGDALWILDGTATTVEHQFENDSDGFIFYNGESTATVAYTGLEPVIDTIAAANRIFTYNGGAETIVLEDDGDVGDGETLIDSTLGEEVLFANPTSTLTINAGSGDDSIELAGLDSSFDADLTVNGGDGSNDAVSITENNDVGSGVVRIGTNDDVEAIMFDGGALTTTTDVILTSVGAISDNGGSTTDITAAQAALRAGTGIGDDSDAIETAADRTAMSLTLAAETVSGDISINNEGTLIVDTVDGLSGVTITDPGSDPSTVTFNSGSPQRPTLITGLQFANGLFDATFDYTSAFGDELYDPTPQTGSSVSEVADAIRDRINMTGTNSSTTIAFLTISDTDPNGNNPSLNLMGGTRVIDGNPSPNNWYSEAFGTNLDRQSTQPDLALIRLSPSQVGDDSGNDNITVKSNGSLTVDAAVTNNDGGNVDLSAEAGGYAGTLTFVESQHSELTGGGNLEHPNTTAVSPDGSHVYVTAAEDHAVTVFMRDQMTGALTFVESEIDGVNGVDGLERANSVTVSPDGDHVYVTSAIDDAIAVFSRNGTTGELTFVDVELDGVGGAGGLNGAGGVTLSPDGEFVYVAGNADDSVAVFNRNAATGELTFVELERDGVGGVDGLDGAIAAIVSPDGQHVYVTAHTDNSIAVFSRNSTTGELSFVEFKRDGVGGIDGLQGPRVPVVSPDGKHVYVPARIENSVAVFSRNASTGALTQVEVLRDGVNGVAGLDGAYKAVVSPDGSNVYVTGLDSNTVSVFARNATSGQLEFVEAERQGVDGVVGLTGPVNLSISPDGRHVYVPATNP
jgi:6-phosphogluconolactonase (cycloisomerase 2 family)